MRIYPIFIPHAGCPHRCLFCDQNRSTGQDSVSDAKQVDSWLESTLPLQGDGEIAFYGGTFSQLPLSLQQDYLTTAGRFVTRGQVSGIRISTRPDALDNQCVARLQDYGVTTVELGCQSFDDAVLTASGRGHSVADNVSAVQCCQSAGFQVGVQLMPGLPAGEAEEALMSMQMALALKPSFVRIYPTVVIAGTELAALWKSGDYTPWALDEAVDICADMLHLCRRAGIPVVRLGLQGEVKLEESLLAGPYHPAFGQLVRSRLWRRALVYANAQSVRHGVNQIGVNPGDLSDVLGHRGENRDWLKTNRLALCLTTDKAAERGCLRISGRNLSLIDLSVHGDHHG